MKKVSYLAHETVLFSKEEEGFVLEPVDDTGQNLTSFLLTVCVTRFVLLLVSENISKTGYCHFRFQPLLLSEFYFMVTVTQNQHQVIHLFCPNLCSQFISPARSSSVSLWFC